MKKTNKKYIADFYNSRSNHQGIMDIIPQYKAGKSHHKKDLDSLYEKFNIKRLNTTKDRALEYLNIYGFDARGAQGGIRESIKNSMINSTTIKSYMERIDVDSFKIKPSISFDDFNKYYMHREKLLLTGQYEDYRNEAPKRAYIDTMEKLNISRLLISKVKELYTEEFFARLNVKNADNTTPTPKGGPMSLPPLTLTYPASQETAEDLEAVERNIAESLGIDYENISDAELEYQREQALNKKQNKERLIKKATEKYGKEFTSRYKKYGVKEVVHSIAMERTINSDKTLHEFRKLSYKNRLSVSKTKILLNNKQLLPTNDRFSDIELRMAIIHKRIESGQSRIVTSNKGNKYITLVNRDDAKLYFRYYEDKFKR